MRIAIAASVGLAFAVAASGCLAAHKMSAKPAAAKPAPSCAALVFRALHAGTADGEQTAGTYSSRLARLELRGSVQNGAPTNYYLMANGSKIGVAASVPPAAGDCAAAKKMPRPGTVAGSCGGDKFTVVVAHAGDKRFALLYGERDGSWSFCNAGSF